MKLKRIFKGVLALMLLAPAAPAMAQDDNIIVRGNIIDWYYYGKDYTGSTSAEGWNQMPTGGYGGVPANFGLFEICVNPSLPKADKFVGMDFIMRNHICYGNAGGVYTGDAFYSFFFHETEESQMTNEEAGSEEYEILVRKWDIEKNTYTTLGRLPFQPTDLTYDPVNDKVYGIFRLYADGDYCYELCELNMEDFSVRQISHAQFDYFYEPRAIAINSKGDIYGINQRGQVLRFNKDNGMYREVGNVGFRTQERYMSAAFDFRTDKLYWMGYKNDGKIDPAATDGTNNTLSIKDGGRDTGLYEVDTKTGVATLLSNCELKEFDMETMKLNWCGKVQLTGMWIDGSFEKKAYDLKVDPMNIPTQINAGEQVELTFKVKNIGTKMVGEDDWKVELYANGELVGTKSGRDLEPSEIRDVKFTYTAPATAGASVTLQAKVVYANDESVENNDTKVMTVAVNSGSTAISNAAEFVTDNAVIRNANGQQVPNFAKPGLYFITKNGKTQKVVIK